MNQKWLSTGEVVKEYGFDPTYAVNIPRSTSGHIANKLVQNKLGCGLCLIRVWLQDDIEPLSSAKREEAVQENNRILTIKYSKRFTRGLKNDQHCRCPT